MARVEIGRYLAIDTRVCGGRLVFKGTRVLEPIRSTPHRLLERENSVLRQAQHERKIFSTGNPQPVRPERVEACPELVEGGDRKAGCCSLSSYADRH